MKLITGGVVVAAVAVVLTGVKALKSSGQGVIDDTDSTVVDAVGPEFNADSAYAFTAAQCDFGPRTMNSDAHDKCRDWIVSKFKEYGCKVQTQDADLHGYDGTMLKSTNIIASYNPEATVRIMICAHWDSRPWADNDPDSTNWQKPVMAANDGASGVAVMIEVARLLNAAKQGKAVKAGAKVAAPEIGVDFVCFDAEDWGVPQWADEQDDNSWALGAQYFATHLPEAFNPRYGILLDMVGGEGAMFYREGMSQRMAPDIVDKVWTAAAQAGYSNYFTNDDGGMVTDDHIPMNQKAGIPTIDIIPYYPDFQRSSFGPTWHTINDTMDHIDRNTLKAVGQAVIQVIYTEK